MPFRGHCIRGPAAAFEERQAAAARRVGGGGQRRRLLGAGGRRSPSPRSRAPPPPCGRSSRRAAARRRERGAAAPARWPAGRPPPRGPWRRCLRSAPLGGCRCADRACSGLTGAARRSGSSPGPRAVLRCPVALRGSRPLWGWPRVWYFSLNRLVRRFSWVGFCICHDTHGPRRGVKAATQPPTARPSYLLTLRSLWRAEPSLPFCTARKVSPHKKRCSGCEMCIKSEFYRSVKGVENQAEVCSWAPSFSCTGRSNSPPIWSSCLSNFQRSLSQLSFVEPQLTRLN